MSEYFMRLAVVGYREYTDYSRVKAILDTWTKSYGPPKAIVSGGARGVDKMGERWAKENNVPSDIYMPDWAKLGKAAGMIRNKDIVDNCDYMIAFPGHNGKGTQHSIVLAKRKKIPVEVYWV